MHVHLFNHVHLMWQANTHVNVHQDLKDVKLWQVIIFFRSSLCAIIIVAYFQDVIIFVFSHTILFFFIFIYKVHTLLKGLEKIAASADIPMLVCGDFNSVPGRFVHCR